MNVGSLRGWNYFPNWNPRGVLAHANFYFTALISVWFFSTGIRTIGSVDQQRQSWPLFRCSARVSLQWLRRTAQAAVDSSQAAVVRQSQPPPPSQTRAMWVQSVATSRKLAPHTSTQTTWTLSLRPLTSSSWRGQLAAGNTRLHPSQGSPFVARTRVWTTWRWAQYHSSRLTCSWRAATRSFPARACSQPCSMRITRLCMRSPLRWPLKRCEWRSRRLQISRMCTMKLPPLRHRTRSRYSFSLLLFPLY